MKKKMIIVICVVVALLVLLVPIPMHIKDGGSVKYSALLYSVTDVHRMDPETDGYEDGTVIKILGFEVYNDVQDVEMADSIRVVYYGGGQIIRWSLSQERIAEVTEWYGNLEYDEIRFREGESPADGEGQAVYELEFSNGISFDYYDCGPEHFIRMGKNWYKVNNPELPPVGEPDNLESV